MRLDHSVFTEAKWCKLINGIKHRLSKVSIAYLLAQRQDLIYGKDEVCKQMKGIYNI